MAMALLTGDTMVYTILVSRNFYRTNGGRRGGVVVFEARVANKRANGSKGQQKSESYPRKAKECLVC